ncbi:MAG: glycerophosphodiester phosphodiesterase family protein, partial [Eubacteriales bacterium]|nr:glycerophosphodiester phosphodiesterase family protein [Eubacteriales bacterium]
MHNSIRYFAHRGVSSKAPENTMPAFELAVQHGVYGIELDVHLTRDGRLAVIHDETTRRTTGQNHLVGELIAQDLKKLD